MPDEPTVAAHEIHVPRAEAPGVPILLLRPQNARGPLPVIMWFHGGGQVLGFAAQDAPWLKRLWAALGCAVAAVDYRLAPETPAPGAAEDGYTAYRWISDNAPDLGLDPTRVGLAWQAILGDRAGTADVTPYCAASRATDLTGLPPTFIGVGELDIFRDENLDYAARLRSCGVPVELHLYPGAYHAFDLFAPQSRLAESFRHTWNNYLARHLTKAPATVTAP